MIKIVEIVFYWVDRVLTFFAETLGMILLVLMTLVSCYIAFTRYYFHETPSWGEALSLLCMIWFGFLSIALGVRSDTHIGVTILDPLFSRPVLRVLNFFKWICVLAFGMFLLVEGINMTEGGAGSMLPGMNINTAWKYLVEPISGILILFYSLGKIFALVLDCLQPKSVNENPGGDQ